MNNNIELSNLFLKSSTNFLLRIGSEVVVYGLCFCAEKIEETNNHQLIKGIRGFGLILSHVLIKEYLPLNLN